MVIPMTCRSSCRSNVTFTIEGEPKGKGRPRFTRGRTYTPPETVSYEQLVALRYRNEANGYKFTSPVGVLIYALHKPPKKSKKVVEKMLREEILPTKRPDVDNIAKIILDGLNKVAWDDDTQVVELHIKKGYAENPEVKVMVYAMEAERC
jgi:Holliday junction resolvase RusA-like endonuclease